MSDNNDYIHSLETCTPLDKAELEKIEKEFGFTYRQGIGELLYAMITCRPDILFPLIKLSQYST